MLDLFVKIQTM